MENKANRPLVIGVTGTFASGKDTVAAYLKTQGFEHFSTADEIRVEMRVLGMPVDRDTMSRFATARRQELGAAYFTQKAIAKIHGAAVVADMRHPDEIIALRALPKFCLIAVDAPIELRFARMKARGRAGDGATLSEFQAKENRELLGTSGGHNIGQVIKQADYTIMNDGTLEQLHKKVDTILVQIRNSTGETRNQ